MKKYIITLSFVFLCLFYVSCVQNNTNTDNDLDEPDEHICENYRSVWMDIKEFTCGETGEQQQICNYCEKVLDTRTFEKSHYYDIKVINEVTCTQDGLKRLTCIYCNDKFETVTPKTGHDTGSLYIVPNDDPIEVTLANVKCDKCDKVLDTVNYIDNGYLENGKLSVVGADLVNERGEKTQLYGLSTHGLQWFGRYANYETIKAIQQEFGNNVIRFALYTDENGYCSGGEAKKEQMLQDLHEGIEAATGLGLYVIVDWHMVGAENVLDKNPLTYLEESKQFFSYISEYYKDQDNILYEIMNEPNGSTTWADCKKYANEVIPCIRKNTDAIILVGNPKWTADLNSVMKSPLTGYENIMYTYHFYAYDHRSTYQVEKAYDAGFPVFISEFGFMNSAGTGELSLTNGNKWKEVLDSRNISYVAWNISNSVGSASIFKYESSDMYDVSDSNLKEWGVYLKYWYREKSGIDN